MDWRVMFTSFLLIFLAELGDKTQLTTMMLAADSHSPVGVFFGAAIALSASAFVGVVLGDVITNVVPVQIIHMVAGAGFLVLGLLLLLNKL